MPRMPLSKTALQQGAQCARMLWIKVNVPYAANPNDGAEQEQFEIGNIVGAAAQGYFTDGETVVINTDRGFNPSNYQSYAAETAAAMSNPAVTCIAEATFYTGDIVVFVDLLHRNGDGTWDIYEVKSGKLVGPVQAQDAAWQTYVARTLCGVPIRNTFLLRPARGWSAIAAKGYTDPDDFEVVDMFSSWIAQVSTNGTVARDISELLMAVDRDVPPPCPGCEPGRGECCHSPYICNYSYKCQELFEAEQQQAQQNGYY